MLENLYLVPFLLGEDPQPHDIWHASNLEWIEYAVEVPQELLSLWDYVALQWAREVSEHPAVVERVERVWCKYSNDPYDIVIKQYYG